MQRFLEDLLSHTRLSFHDISERPRPVKIGIEVTDHVKITVDNSTSWNVRKFHVEMNYTLVGATRLLKTTEIIQVNGSCSPCDLRASNLTGKKDQLQFVSVRVQVVNNFGERSDYSETVTWGSHKYKLIHVSSQSVRHQLLKMLCNCLLLNHEVFGET